MKILSFCPYGSFSEEAGILYLLASYLNSSGHQLLHAQCNGIFPICERDQKIGWKRSLESCSLCMGEQRALAQLGGVEVIELSKYLTSNDIVNSLRRISAISRDDLVEAEYEGISLFSVCLPVFKKMFGRDEPHFLHRHHEPALRHLFTSTILSFEAAAKVARIYQPDTALIADGIDIVTQAFLRAFDRCSVDSVTLRWREESNNIRIFQHSQSESLEIDFFVEAISLIQMSSFRR
jgi:hypothetical protein